MLEGNVPDAEPETASIVGIYGDATSSELQYIEFKEDGTGKTVYYDNSKNEKVVEEFTYILNDDGTGTVTLEDNEVVEFKHEVKKDSNGEIINKIVYYGKYTGTYKEREITFFGAVLTTNGKNGIEKPNKTYEAVDSGNIAEVSFNDGEATLKYKDGTEEILSDTSCIKCDNFIYCGSTNKEGFYGPVFIVWDDTKIETISS